MAISVGGMLGFFLLFSVVFDDFLYVSNWIYNQPIFWFFGFFSVPLFAVLIDVIGKDYYAFLLLFYFFTIDFI